MKSETKKKSAKTPVTSHFGMRKHPKDISDARAKEIDVLIRAIWSELTPSLVHLKPEKRRGMLRMPPRSQSVMTLVLGLARERGLLLGPKGDTRVERAVALATRLASPVRALEVLRQGMQDTMRVAEADAWGETAALYTALVSIARYDVVLGERLAPAREFFKKRRRGGGKARAKKAASKKKASE
jgi:hypothetical protein